MLTPVILAGGNGTRLWPLSTPSFPKPFLNLFNEESLLQSTFHRIEQLSLAKYKSIIVCQDEHRFVVAEHLREFLEKVEIILEPVARNTAPAIALAAFHALQTDKESILLVLPADHVISDSRKFEKAINQAVQLAQLNKMVTFGVFPNEAKTNYGYIKKGKIFQKNAYQVESFVEKPNAVQAREFFDSGEYLWNSGIFVFPAKLFLEELKIYQPDIYESSLTSISRATADLDFIRIEENSYQQSPCDSIDYALMECTELAVVLPVHFNWDDIGTWNSYTKYLTKNENGSINLGKVLEYDSNENFVVAENKLVSLLGIDNTTVINTPDNLLIANTDHLDKLKDFIEEFKDEIFSQQVSKSHRPWGYYEIIKSSKSFVVKKLFIKPGGKISLQKHYQRSEHWVIVKGIALVTKDGQEFEMCENESIFIPVGSIHSIENSFNEPLEIIEIQTGSILREDDIFRLKDDYGRV